MDNNLDDSLNLESAMGVDFEHSEDAVVNQNDITLEYSGHEESIPMEFEPNEEQPILMDTGSEEIIVSDFMGDQFSLQEYSVQSDQTTGLTTTVESNQQQIISSQAESMIDLQFQPQLLNTIKQEAIPHKVIAVKTMSPMRTSKKNESALLTAPRQVAIAPKPPKLIAKPFPNKQPAIAPKPVTFIANRGGGSLVKKLPISAVPSNSKGNTVVAQIGKQLIMVPSSGSQRIKLVSTSGSMSNVQYLRADPDQAQLIATKSVSGSQNKPVLTKLIPVQGQPQLSSQQPAVITKLVGGKGPRFVTMQQKTMPISLANKVLLATPSKQGLKLAKKQEIISIKSPTHKLMPAPALNASSSSAGKQKVVIPANSSQNVVLKVPAPTKQQGIKDCSMIVDGQRTQLHEINVPGKGVQYFRLITNSATSKPAPKSLVAVPSKTFMLADNKGNLIQMSAEKLVSGQPPSLVVAGNKTATLTKVASKPQQKLVRIAPVLPKTLQAVTHPPRSSQSLLAPLSPAADAAADAGADADAGAAAGAGGAEPAGGSDEEVDSKDALRALIEKAVSDNVTEVEVEFEGQHSATSENSADADGMEALDASARSDDHPLIVIPSNYDNSSTDAHNRTDDSQRSLLNIENDVLNPYQSPTTPAPSESELVATELGLRPRKACNCTKSQCLKLYCDCFANGEFCNRCNCNNCHNNLENEELRQKAIRGCLERNPNAFRPKIGKAKIGGPDIIRRHNKGCNCKRSGCLKNYCECYEAKIACTSICKCVGCRNVEETLERARRRDARAPREAACRPAPPASAKQPCSFMTSEVIEAVCQCLLAAAAERAGAGAGADAVRGVLDEFARCLQDIISAAHQTAPLSILDGIL